MSVSVFFFTRLGLKKNITVGKCYEEKNTCLQQQVYYLGWSSVYARVYSLHLWLFVCTLYCNTQQSTNCIQS